MRSRSKKILFVGAAVLMVASMGLGSGTPSSAGEPVSVPTNAPAKSALPRLVDLGAVKCIPCKMMVSVLADLKTNYVGQLEVEFIDVWKNPDAGKPYKINLIPTQVFYDAKGKELFRHEGFFAKKDILAKWREFGVDLKSGGRSPKAGGEKAVK